MKKLFTIMAATAVAGLALTAFAPVSAQEPTVDYGYIIPDNSTRVLEKMSAAEFKSDTGSLNYRIYKSPNYKADDKSNPAMLVVFLHGSGGTGDDNAQQIKDQQTLVNYLVSDSADQILTKPFIVVAPQCPTGDQWVKVKDYYNNNYSIDSTPETTSLKLVGELVDDLVAKENIDADNLTLGGISMGGYGTWDFALRHPEKFAALIPICGAGDPTKAGNIMDKRIWVFHGDADQAVPVQSSRNMVEALKTLNAPHLTYTEFAGVGHNSWKPAMEVSDPYLMQWIFENVSYAIKTQAEGEGTITETVTGVNKGDTVVVEMMPKEGHMLSALYVNDMEVTPLVKQDGSISYTFESIAQSHDVRAVFEPIPVEEEPTENKDGGLGTGAIIGIAAGAAAVAAAVTAAVVVTKKKKKKQ